MVYVLDKRKKPLWPCSIKRARRAKDQSRLERIFRQPRRSLKDATRVNATRWALYGALQLPVLPASVGKTDAVVETAGSRQSALPITADGRGAYPRTRLTEDGFPRGYLMRSGWVPLFHAGDHAKAMLPKDSKRGTNLGRGSPRETGSTNLKTTTPAIEGINHRHCRLAQRLDGCGYQLASHFQDFIGRNLFPPRPQHRGFRT